MIIPLIIHILEWGKQLTPCESSNKGTIRDYGLRATVDRILT